MQRSPSRSQDPYRYQFASPLQRRYQEAKQQQQMQQQLQEQSLQYSQSSPHAAETGSPVTSSILVRTREDWHALQSQPLSRSSSWSRSQSAQHLSHSQQQQEDGMRDSLSIATPPRRTHPSDPFGRDADQNLLFQTELDQIAVYQEHRQQQRDLRMTSVTDEDMMTMSSRDESLGYEDSEESGHKRKFGMMSIDSAPPGLERPKLVAKNRRRKSRYSQQDPQQQDEQDQQQSSKNLLELDASQQELVDITTDDEMAVISQLTFKQLHEQVVRRLRLTQRLLQNRRIELAEEQRRDRLEREQALREGGEDNKARRERRERERAKEKGKKQHSS
ncbi:unnamed protein product [Mortierella alpina]